jgi:hypothetical protein
MIASPVLIFWSILGVRKGSIVKALSYVALLRVHWLLSVITIVCF